MEEACLPPSSGKEKEATRQNQKALLHLQTYPGLLHQLHFLTAGHQEPVSSLDCSPGALRHTGRKHGRSTSTLHQRQFTFL